MSHVAQAIPQAHYVAKGDLHRLSAGLYACTTGFCLCVKVALGTCSSDTLPVELRLQRCFPVSLFRVFIWICKRNLSRKINVQKWKQSFGVHPEIVIIYLENYYIMFII